MSSILARLYACERKVEWLLRELSRLTLEIERLRQQLRELGGQ